LLPLFICVTASQSAVVLVQQHAWSSMEEQRRRKRGHGAAVEGAAESSTPLSSSLFLSVSEVLLQMHRRWPLESTLPPSVRSSSPSAHMQDLDACWLQLERLYHAVSQASREEAESGSSGSASVKSARPATTSLVAFVHTASALTPQRVVDELEKTRSRD
jgi:hypothetical protein